jgi:hypothetical protein
MVTAAALCAILIPRTMASMPPRSGNNISWDVRTGVTCKGEKYEFIHNVTTVNFCKDQCAQAQPTCVGFQWKRRVSPGETHWCTLFNASAFEGASRGGADYDCGCRGTCPSLPPPHPLPPGPPRPPPPGPPGPPAPAPAPPTPNYNKDLGVGLAGCDVVHPQLLVQWRYNATTFTMEATDAGRSCKNPNDPSSCHTVQCLSLDFSYQGLPTPAGSGVILGPTCSKSFAPGANFSAERSSWSLSRSGRLQSMYAGMQGFCLTHAPSGVLELRACAQASSWQLDPKSGRLSVGGGGSGGAPADRSSSAAAKTCLIALNTSGVILAGQHNGSSVAHCDSAPGNLLPFCDVALPIPQRVQNLLSFVSVRELPQNWARFGLPKAPPTGECLHGFVTDCVDNSTCPTIFPDALVTASSWNDTLFEQVGRAISVEGKAVDNIYAAAAAALGSDARGSGPHPHRICWSPDLNPFRHPLWGRGQEVRLAEYALVRTGPTLCVL